jgi:COPII coat assembly protein SEC16
VTCSHVFNRSDIDAAVRSALLPNSKAATDDSLSSLPSTLSSVSTLDSFASSPVLSDEDPVSISALKPSALHKLKHLLLTGERRQAYHYALDEKLWAHAMIISGGLDKEAWREAVNEFLRAELGQTFANSEKTSALESDAEILRVAYSFLSGQGAASRKYTI